MMINYMVRSNYLHEVQRTFGGTGNLDVMGFFTQALSVLVPMILVIMSVFPKELYMGQNQVVLLQPG